MILYANRDSGEVGLASHIPEGCLPIVRGYDTLLTKARPFLSLGRDPKRVQYFLPGQGNVRLSMEERAEMLASYLNVDLSCKELEHEALSSREWQGLPDEDTWVATISGESFILDDRRGLYSSAKAVMRAAGALSEKEKVLAAWEADLKHKEETLRKQAQDNNLLRDILNKKIEEYNNAYSDMEVAYFCPKQAQKFPTTGTAMSMTCRRSSTLKTPVSGSSKASSGSNPHRTTNSPSAISWRSTF